MVAMRRGVGMAIGVSLACFLTAILTYSAWPYWLMCFEVRLFSPKIASQGLIDWAARNPSSVERCLDSIGLDSLGVSCVCVALETKHRQLVTDRLESMYFSSKPGDVFWKLAAVEIMFKHTKNIKWLIECEKLAKANLANRGVVGYASSVFETGMLPVAPMELRDSPEVLRLRRSFRTMCDRDSTNTTVNPGHT